MLDVVPGVGPSAVVFADRVPQPVMLVECGHVQLPRLIRGRGDTLGRAKNAPVGVSHQWVDQVIVVRSPPPGAEIVTSDRAIQVRIDPIEVAACGDVVKRSQVFSTSSNCPQRRIREPMRGLPDAAACSLANAMKPAQSGAAALVPAKPVHVPFEKTVMLPPRVTVLGSSRAVRLARQPAPRETRAALAIRVDARGRIRSAAAAAARDPSLAS